MARSYKILFCYRCGDVRSLVVARFTACRCGNMAARWKTNARQTVEVIAGHKEAARIIDLTLTVLNHESSLLKVGKTPDISWCPRRQKEIDACRKLVTDYVERKTTHRENQVYNGRIRFTQPRAWPHRTVKV